MLIKITFLFAYCLMERQNVMHLGFCYGFFFKLLGRQKDYLYFCTTFLNAPVVQWIEYRIPVPTI